MIKNVLKKFLTWRSRFLLRRILHFGFKFKCNVCGSHVKRLLDVGTRTPVLYELDVIGGKYRTEDTCPVCFAHCRTRLLHHYLVEELKIETQRLRLLHVAPELGLSFAITKLKNITYTPADLVVKRHAFPVEQMDISQINYGPGSFDAIICNHVLEHIQNDELAMTELLRVLTPGGWAILQVPISRKLRQTYEDPNITDPAERLRHFGQEDHVRIYAMDYVDRLSKVGFSVEVFDPQVRWRKELIAALRLDPEEKIFLARKPL